MGKRSAVPGLHPPLAPSLLLPLPGFLSRVMSLGSLFLCLALLLAGSAPLLAEEAPTSAFAPLLMPIDHGVKGHQAIYAADLTADGWLLGTNRGLLTARGGRWVAEEAFAGDWFQWIKTGTDGTRYASGLAFAARHRTTWERIPMTELIHSGLIIDDGCLLVGESNVYHWPKHESAPRKIFALNSSARSRSYVNDLGHGPRIFTSTQGVLRWDGNSLAPDPAYAHFGDTDVAWSTVHNGEIFYLTSSAVLGSVARGKLLHRDQFPPDTFRLSVGIVIFGDQLICASYGNGLVGISISGAKILWRLTTAELGGSPIFSSAMENGALIGTTGGVLFLADPTRTVAATGATSRNPHFLTRSANYPILGSPEGIWTPRSQQKNILGALTYRATERGSYVGTWSRILAPDREIRISARYTSDLAVDRSGRIAYAYDTTVRVLTPEGTELHEAQLPSSTSGLASVSDGTWIVATSDGAYRYQADLTNPIHLLGDKTAVRSDGAHIAVYSSTGRIVDADGRPLATLPAGWELLDLSDLNGRLLGLVSRPDVGVIPAQIAPFAPLQCDGLPNDARLLVGIGETLYVATANRIYRFESPPLLSAPSLRVDSASGTWSLAADRSDLDVVFRGFVPPWLPAPLHEVQVNGAPWQAIPRDGLATLPRLPWGRSAVTFRTTRAGLAVTQAVDVTRAYPWWLRWPAFVGYIGFVGAAGWSVLHWRLRRARRREAVLQATVAARTHELRQAQAARELFIASLSHEVRNPLNGIAGVARMLRQEASPRQDFLLATLDGCVSQIGGIVDDILDFRAIDEGRIAAENKPVELRALAATTCAALDPSGQALRVVMAEPICWVSADEGKLRQILGNYGANALKYGLPPGGELHVECRAADATHVAVTFTLQSHGPTLSAEEMGRLFAPFARGSRAQATGTQGAGLGLARCRKLALALGHETGVTSEGGTTRFFLRAHFPRATAPVTAAAPTTEFPHRRVLAVEDEQFNRLVLGHELAAAGCEVTWAETGERARALLHTQTFDLIVTDWLLPDCDGGVLLGQLRAQLGAQLPPVIVITAYSTERQRAECFAAGATAFLSKPVSVEKLRATLAGLPLPPDAPAPAAALVETIDLSRLLRAGPAATVVASFLADLEQTNRRLAAADSPAALRAILHELRGKLLLIGAHSLAARLQTLEAAASAASDRATLAAPLAEILNDLDRLRREIAPTRGAPDS